MVLLRNAFEVLRWIIYGLEIYLLVDWITRLCLKEYVYGELLFLMTFLGLIILIDLGVI